MNFHRSFLWFSSSSQEEDLISARKFSSEKFSDCWIDSVFDCWVDFFGEKKKKSSQIPTQQISTTSSKFWPKILQYTTFRWCLPNSFNLLFLNQLYPFTNLLFWIVCILCYDLLDKFWVHLSYSCLLCPIIFSIFILLFFDKIMLLLLIFLLSHLYFTLCIFLFVTVGC